MSTMAIEVAETHPPQNGKKLAKVKSRSGQVFQVWPDKLPTIQVGQKYDVEVEESEFQGRTYYKITKIKPSAAPAEMGGENRSQAGAATPGAGTPRQNEEAFVRDLLVAFIAANHIVPDPKRIIQAIEALRTAYQQTFGGTR